MSTGILGVATASAGPVAAALRRRQVGLLVAAHIRSKVFHQLSSNGPPSGVPFEPLFWPASTAPPSSTQSSSEQGHRSGSKKGFITSEWGMTFDQRVRMLARRAPPPPSSDLFSPIPRPTELSLLASQKSAIPFAFHDDRSVLLSLSVPERFALGQLPAIFAPFQPPAMGISSPLVSAAPSVRHVVEPPVEQTPPLVPTMMVAATPAVERQLMLTEDAVSTAVQAEVAVEFEVDTNDPLLRQTSPPWLGRILDAAAYRYSDVYWMMRELRRRMHKDVQFARNPNRPSILQRLAASLLKNGHTSMAREVLAVINDEGWVVEPGLALSASSAFIDQNASVPNRLFAAELVAVPLAIPVLEDMPIHISEDVFCAALARLHKSGTHGHVINQLANSYLGSSAQHASIGSVPGEPNRAMASILIAATAAYDMDLASTWLQRYRSYCKSLQQRGIESTNSTTPYTTLIAQQVHHGDFASAFETLDIMGADNVQPSVALYNLLLSSRVTERSGDTRSLNDKQDDAVERSFRVLQTLPADFLRNRADRFTFATIWKTHERWRARLILRTSDACPRTLWSLMMWRAQHRGQAGIPRLDVTTPLLNLALRVFLKRHDYAAAIIALEAIPNPDKDTHDAIVGELSRRLSGELRTQQKAANHIDRVLHRRYEHGVDSEWQSEGVVRDKVRTLTTWTDCFLAESGGLATRGQWLRIYLSRDGRIADLDNVINWLLGDIQHAEPLPFNLQPVERPPLVDRRVNRSNQLAQVDTKPLRELLRRAHLAEHNASALSPIARQHEIVDRGLASARRKMRPRRPTKWELGCEEEGS